MKKSALFVTAAALALLLSACGPTSSQGVAPASPSSLPSPTAKPSPSPSPLDERGIDGSNLDDVTTSLISTGIPRGEVKKSADQSACTYYVSSSSTDANSLDEYDYDIGSDNENNIISATFGSTYGGFESDDTYCTVAASYLRYGVAMHYSTENVDAAKAFITENIPSVADAGTDGKAGEVSTTIGDASFTLYGVKKNGHYTTFWLTVEKAK